MAAMTAPGGNGSARTSRAALAVGIVALLIAGLVAVALLRDGGTGGGGGGGWFGRTGDGSEGGGGDAFDATPRHGIQGSARSVIFEGRVLSLGSVNLDGIEQLSVDGEVLDSGGTVIGRGTVEATGNAHVTGAAIELATAGLRFRPGQPALAAAVAGGRTHLSITAPGPVQLNGGQLRFRPREGQPEPRAISGPVTVRPDAGSVDARIEGEQVRWLDVPEQLALAHPGSGRATLSWAGEGTIEAQEVGTVSASFLGIKAERLQGELSQAGGALLITATASLRQVYANGLPQLRTTGAAVVKEVRGAPAGERAWFRWAPENRGQHDMTITRIAPGNGAGGWVNLALDQLPEMCGGEMCPRHGGDTAGLGKKGSGGFLGIGSRSAQPIDAVILPGTGDESEVSIDIPAGTPPGEQVVSLILEGNFDPVRVEVRVPVS